MNMNDTMMNMTDMMMNMSMTMSMGTMDHGGGGGGGGGGGHGGHGGHEGHDMTTASEHAGHGAAGGGHGSYFTWNDEVTFLFKGWVTETAAQYVLTMVFLVVLAILAESLRAFRRNVEGRLRDLRTQYELDPDNTNVINAIYLWRFGRMALLTLHLFLSYVLMLAFMTFNIGLCLAVLVGSAVAYISFDPFLVPAHSLKPKKIKLTSAEGGNTAYSSYSSSSEDTVEGDIAGCH